jgi:large subunit ribosomal protein L5
MWVNKMARLKEYYLKNVVPALVKEFSYKNPMQVPKIEKIVINMGLGEAIQNVKIIDSAVQELAAITGQKPIINKAKKSIATFKLRQGMPIGCSVTLRKKIMYEFFDRLVNAALPKVRDFRGISPNAFDGRGNFSIGLQEQIIFPEIEYDKVEKVKGMNITIVTTAKTNAEARYLLKMMGVPFKQ